MALETAIGISVAILTMIVLILREISRFNERVDAADKAIEEKLTQAIDAEIKRNDDITSRIDREAKEVAADQKVLVQRVTKVETICEECAGRGMRCGEEKDG